MKGSGDENKLSRRKQRNVVGYKWKNIPNMPNFRYLK
jgi:hypothetical protein